MSVIVALSAGVPKATVGGCCGIPDARIIQDIAPSSLFAPLTVLVAVPAVIEVAVLNWKPPASASISSPKFDHVLAVPSEAPPITASIPPPAAIVVEPVVKRSSCASVVPSPPDVKVSEAPVTL